MEGILMLSRLHHSGKKTNGVSVTKLNVPANGKVPELVTPPSSKQQLDDSTPTGDDDDQGQDGGDNTDASKPKPRNPIVQPNFDRMSRAIDVLDGNFCLSNVTPPGSAQIAALLDSDFKPRPAPPSAVGSKSQAAGAAPAPPAPSYNSDAAYTDKLLQRAVAALFSEDAFLKSEMKDKLMQMTIKAAGKDAWPSSNLAEYAKLDPRDAVFTPEENELAGKFIPLLCELMTVIRLHVELREGKRSTPSLDPFQIVDQTWREVLTMMNEIRNAFAYSRQNRMITKLPRKVIGFLERDMIDEVHNTKFKKNTELLQLDTEINALSRQMLDYDEKINKIQSEASLVKAKLQRANESRETLQREILCLTDPQFLAEGTLQQIVVMGGDTEFSNSEAAMRSARQPGRQYAVTETLRRLLNMYH